MFSCWKIRFGIREKLCKVFQMTKKHKFSNSFVFVRFFSFFEKIRSILFEGHSVLFWQQAFLHWLFVCFFCYFRCLFLACKLEQFTAAYFFSWWVDIQKGMSRHSTNDILQMRNYCVNVLPKTSQSLVSMKIERVATINAINNTTNNIFVYVFFPVQESRCYKYNKLE